jgi:uncharacterized protein with PhoU and TrkA domain
MRISEIVCIAGTNILHAVPPKSGLENKTLRESRLGAALGLNVVGIYRAGQRFLAPEPSLVIRAEIA